MHVAIALVAAIVFFLRSDRLERTALALAAIASGSTSIFGFGFHGPEVMAARLLSHVTAYSVWAVTAGRILALRARRRRQAASERGAPG